MRGPTAATRRDMARKERTTGFDGVRELLQKLLYVDLVAVGIVYSPTECGEGGSQARSDVHDGRSSQERDRESR